MDANIVTAQDNHTNSSNSLEILGWHELHAAKFTFDHPFRLNLDDGQVIDAHKVVRVMPRKRMVVFGSWGGRPVVAKLFYDPHKAKRQMESDMIGMSTLGMNKIPAPHIYHTGVSEDRRVYVLVYERIADAVSFQEIWQKKENTDAVQTLMQSALIELATQHVLGVQQGDLHFKNFLLQGEVIYTLDGGQVTSQDEILSKEDSMDSISLFLAQMGAGLEKYQEELFLYYAQSRGWIIRPADIYGLFSLIKMWNTKRWAQFKRKIFRESTDFNVVRGKHLYGMMERSYGGMEFMTFLKNPDAIFHHPTAMVLKDGRSATVVKVTLDQRDLVVKRYNMKDAWHQLRRCTRATRAAKSWELAHKLSLFGIPTARPVAYLERKVMGFRGQSYFVSEYVSGGHAGEYFARVRGDEAKIKTMAEKIVALLTNLKKLQVTHGDLKITNILVNGKEQPVLIDLDGAVEHTSLSTLKRAWIKEIERFLQNFQQLPTLQQLFKKVFTERR